MKFYKMLLALLLATTAMCLCTENSFAAELIQETAVPGVLEAPADTLNTVPAIAAVPAVDTVIPTTEVEAPAVVTEVETPVILTDTKEAVEGEIPLVATTDAVVADSTITPNEATELLPDIDPALIQAYELQAAEILAYQQMAALSEVPEEDSIKTETQSIKAKKKNTKKQKKLTDIFKKPQPEVIKEEIPLPDSEELSKLAATVEANSLFSTDDVMLVAKLISHEAKGQSPDGWAAVAEVVLNRINTPLYPNTVHDVIYQRGQFSHSRGIKKENPTTEMILMADLVLNYNYRVLNDPAVVNFRNPKKTNGFSANVKKNWGALEYFTCIDDHAFYANRNVSSADEIPEDIKHNMFMAIKKNFAKNS